MRLVKRAWSASLDCILFERFLAKTPLAYARGSMWSRDRQGAESSLIRLKPLLQTLPAFEILVLQHPRLHRVPRRTQDKLRLEHERQRVRDVLRLQLRMARALERLRIRPMPGH